MRRSWQILIHIGRNLLRKAKAPLKWDVYLGIQGEVPYSRSYSPGALGRMVSPWLAKTWCWKSWSFEGLDFLLSASPPKTFQLSFPNKRLFLVYIFAKWVACSGLYPIFKKLVPIYFHFLWGKKTTFSMS